MHGIRRINIDGRERRERGLIDNIFTIPYEELSGIAATAPSFNYARASCDGRLLVRTQASRIHLLNLPF